MFIILMVIIPMIISINLIIIIIIHITIMIISMFIYEQNSVIVSLAEWVSKWLKLGQKQIKKRQKNPKNCSGLQFLSWLIVKGFGTSLS